MNRQPRLRGWGEIEKKIITLMTNKHLTIPGITAPPVLRSPLPRVPTRRRTRNQNNIPSNIIFDDKDIFENLPNYSTPKVINVYNPNCNQIREQADVCKIDLNAMINSKDVEPKNEDAFDSFSNNYLDEIGNDSRFWCESSESNQLTTPESDMYNYDN
jgi:hypothetical protein